jgi:hypothetical protein
VSKNNIQRASGKTDAKILKWILKKEKCLSVVWILLGQIMAQIGFLSGGIKEAGILMIKADHIRTISITTPLITKQGIMKIFGDKKRRGF